MKSKKIIRTVTAVMSALLVVSSAVSAAAYSNITEYDVIISDTSAGKHIDSKATLNSETGIVSDGINPINTETKVVTSDMLSGNMMIDASAIPSGGDSISLKANTTLSDINTLKNDKTNFAAVKEVKDSSRSLNFTEQIWEQALSAKGIAYDSDGKITNTNGTTYIQSWDLGKDYSKPVFYDGLHIYVQTGIETGTGNDWKTPLGITVGETSLKKLPSKAIMHLDSTARDVIDMENEELNPNYPRELSRYSFNGQYFIYNLQNENKSFKPSKVVVKFVTTEAGAKGISVGTNRSEEYSSGELDTTADKSGVLNLSVEKNNDYTSEQIQWKGADNKDYWTNYNSYSATITDFTADDMYFGFLESSLNLYVYAVDVYCYDGMELEYNVSKTVDKDSSRSLNFTEQIWEQALSAKGIAYDSDGKITNTNGTTYIQSWDLGKDYSKPVFYDGLHIYVQTGIETGTGNDWKTPLGITVGETSLKKLPSKAIMHLDSTARDVIDMENEELNPNYPRELSRYSFNGQYFIYNLQNENKSFKPSKVVVKFVTTEAGAKGISVGTNRSEEYSSGELDTTADKSGVLNLSVEKNNDYTSEQIQWKGADNKDYWTNYNSYSATITDFTADDMYFGFLESSLNLYVYAVDVYAEKVNYNISGLSGVGDYDFIRANIYYPSESLCGVAENDADFAEFISDNSIASKDDAEQYNTEHSDRPIIFTSNQLSLDKIAVKKDADINISVTDMSWSVTSNCTDSGYGTVIIGAFDSEGTLLEILNTARIPVSGGSGNIKSVKPEGTKLLKAMFWEDMTYMKPVCVKSEYIR